MLIRVDPSLSQPLFEQLAAAVRRAVVRGEVVAGQRLPSARELAESLELNVHTVLHAYQQLRDEGLIELRRGRGAIVRAEAVDAGALGESVAALVAEARRRGVPAGMLTALIEEEYR